MNAAPSQMNETRHVSVMVREVLEALGASAGGRFLDCTLGGAGHTAAILESHPDNQVVALDRDARAIERAGRRLGNFAGRFTLIHRSFSELAEIPELGVFDGVLADLGISTDQLKEGRGFSFGDHDSLDMRMNEQQGVTAAELVNTLGEQELFVMLREGGVGPEAREVARAIVRARPISSGAALADAVRSASRKKRSIDPATVVFQALRMRVNNELGEIGELMGVVPGLAHRGTRLAVITFHSLEDKAVVGVMRGWQAGDDAPAWYPGARERVRIGRVVHRKPVLPSEDEISANPSARSARLRVFEFEGN